MLRYFLGRQIARLWRTTFGKILVVVVVVNTLIMLTILGSLAGA